MSAVSLCCGIPKCTQNGIRFLSALLIHVNTRQRSSWLWNEFSAPSRIQTLHSCERMISEVNILTNSFNSWNYRMACVKKPSRYMLPAMGRDTFHETRLHKATSSLVLSIFRDGASSSWAACACVSPPAQSRISFIYLNFLCVSLKPFPFILSWLTPLKTPSPSPYLSLYLRYWKLLGSPPGAFSSPGWTTSVLWTCVHRRGLQTLINSWLSSGHAPTRPCLHWRSQSWMQRY